MTEENRTLLTKETEFKRKGTEILRAESLHNTENIGGWKSMAIWP